MGYSKLSINHAEGVPKDGSFLKPADDYDLNAAPVFVQLLTPFEGERSQYTPGPLPYWDLKIKTSERVLLLTGFPFTGLITHKLIAQSTHDSCHHLPSSC